MFARPRRDPPRPVRRRDPVRTAILIAGLLGAALLLVAEFTTLYSVHVAGRSGIASTAGTGAHHSFALVPVALLAAVLAVGARRSVTWPAPLALGALGAFALLVALLGDLPDAHAHGLTRSFVLASATPGVGLYLETLGGVLLLLVSGLGLAMHPRSAGAAESEPSP